MEEIFTPAQAPQGWAIGWIELDIFPDKKIKSVT
jgi:hypothetical protein